MDADFTMIDFETYYAEDFSVSDSTYWHYTHDPRFEAYLVSIVGPDISYVGPVETAPWDKLIGRPLIAHNAAFEEAVLEFLIEVGKVPPLRTPAFHCTADLCAYHQMPRALANASREVLNRKASKEIRNMMKGKRWSSLDSAARQAVSDYNMTDSVNGRDLWTALSPTWPSTERFLSDHTRHTGRRGIFIDQERLNRGIATLQEGLFHLGAMLPWFTSSDIKPLSLVHIREQGRLEGIEVPGSLDLRDPDAKAWEAKWAPTKPWVRALRGYRRVNALLKKLQTLKAMLRPDGYASFQMKYFGAAATGRWSGSGGFNIQNLPKAPAVLCKSCWGCDFDEDAEKKTDANTLVCPLCKSTDVETIDMRGLLMASPGKTLIISDYAQIEARMLLWQVNDRATLDLVAKGMSVYEAHARATMGWTGGNLKKENPKLYFLAKCRVLGCGYGIGKGKFQALAALWGFDMSLEDAGIAVAEYRQSNPLVTNRWRAHQLWLKVSINHTDPTHEVPLANGRTIKYFAPHVDAESKPDWPEFAAHTVKGEARQLRRLYGGKLTENETQANARNKMGDGIEAVEKAGIPVLFHAHDEAIGEVAKDQVKDAVREMEYALVSSSEWAKGCPLAVETQTSDRYTK